MELRFLSVSENGEIESLRPIESLVKLETLWFHSSTRIKDGDLDFLRAHRTLRDVRFMNRAAYSVRSEAFPKKGIFREPRTQYD